MDANDATYDSVGGTMDPIPTYRTFRVNQFLRLRREYQVSLREIHDRYPESHWVGMWVTMLYHLPRTAVVGLDVGRSAVTLLGHREASRMLRHVANFPACLPTDRQRALRMAQ